MEDGLGVAAAVVSVAAGFQPRAQRGMVVDLAVEDDPDRAILVGHRLMPATHVHDGQAPMSEPHGAVDEQALAVGAAVTKNVPHPLEPRLLHGLVDVELRDAGDAAHGRVRSSGQ